MQRFWEIFPAASVWGTFLLLFFLSSKAPVAVAIFIILYDLYWVLKILYIFLYLHSSFRRMRKNESVNWKLKLEVNFKDSWEKIHHLIVIPTYHEPPEVLRATMLSMLNANYPKDKIHIVLALEERGGTNDIEVGRLIQEEFGKNFSSFIISVHPANLPNEIPGKGSNESWALKAALKEILLPKNISHEYVLVTVFDSDTQSGSEYFGVLTHAFLSSPHGERASFQPIPIFANNLHKTSMVARLIGLSSTFWQLIEQSRMERLITFSSHSIPLRPLLEVGLWERNIVSEDSRIFFQLLNHYNGDWRAIPLHYPVYMDAVSGNTFWESIKNIYRQQRRWGWGSENLSRFMSDISKNHYFPRKQMLHWVWLLISGFYTWASSSFIIFFFGWLPLILGDDAFRETVVAYNLPRLTSGILNFTMIGIIGLALVGFFLTMPRLKDFRKRHYILYVLQWILTPFVFMFLGSLPALDAQTRLMLGGKFKLGFWKTPKN